MDPDALIHAYLGRVESAASRLEPERRAELVADLRDHIALALRGKAGLIIFVLASLRRSWSCRPWPPES
jgi:hypothetical protein